MVSTLLDRSMDALGCAKRAMNERLTFTLPLPANPNSSELRGRHHQVRHKKKREWQEHALVAMRLQGVAFPSEPWPRARLDCHFFVRRLMDADDNLPARRKWIQDLLACERYTVRVANRPQTVYSKGFVKDDSTRCLERGETTQAIDWKDPRVEIVLDRLE